MAGGAGGFVACRRCFVCIVWVRVRGVVCVALWAALGCCVCGFDVADGVDIAGCAVVNVFCLV